MENNQKSLREILNEELQRRRARRSAYSLRAFARNLRMSPSFLCEIMGGRKLPSPVMAERILTEINSNKEA